MSLVEFVLVTALASARCCFFESVRIRKVITNNSAWEKAGSVGALWKYVFSLFLFPFCVRVAPASNFIIHCQTSEQFSNFQISDYSGKNQL